SRFNEHLEGDGPTVFAHACKMGLEDIVSKPQGLDVSLRPLAGLPQNEEPGGSSSEAASRRGLGEMTEDHGGSGEFADLQPTPKVYLASNIVSAIAKDDTPTESEALNRLLQAWDDKKVDLVTSEVTLWEINAYQDELKHRFVERTYRRLAKAQIVRWYE